MTHILVVDDEPDARDLFRQNFRREIRSGVYDFDFAESGQAALALLRSADAGAGAETAPETSAVAIPETDADAGTSHGAVAVVLSDINMPGMSGTELLADIRATWPDLPVMMITAYGDTATEARVRALGAESFMTKPVDFGTLKLALKQVVGTGG